MFCLVSLVVVVVEEEDYILIPNPNPKKILTPPNA